MKKDVQCSAPAGAVYGMGFIGAFLVYEALKHLAM